MGRGIRENTKYLEGKRDLTATQDARFIKIWARDAGLFSCLSGIREIVRSSSECESACKCSVVCPIKANYKINAFKKSTEQTEDPLFQPDTKRVHLVLAYH